MDCIQVNLNIIIIDKEKRMAKEKAKPKAVKENNVVKKEHLNEIWNVVDEHQKNLDFLNEKIQRLLSRMGLE